jgi:hypothetical protein
MWDQVRAAKPSFIARVRATQYRVVTEDTEQLDECVICREQIGFNAKYASWPCPADHHFHLECMVKALRESNKCPLCRYEVEGVPVPGRDEVLRWRIEMPLITSIMEWRRVHPNDG